MSFIEFFYGILADWVQDPKTIEQIEAFKQAGDKEALEIALRNRG
jgi:hypothetical protein